MNNHVGLMRNRSYAHKLVMIVLVLGVVVFVFGTKIFIIFARILTPQQRQIYT